MNTNEFEVKTLGGSTIRVSNRVIGDTPQHGRHLLWDAMHNTLTEIDGGLAFAIGVACMEAELSRDTSRYWQVQHPNGVAIYHVAYIESGSVTVVHIGG